MNILLDNVMKDVNTIYIGEDKTTKTYVKNYELKEGSKVINSVQIVYERTWIEESTSSSSHISGNAKLNFCHSNEFLANSIIKIIQEPVYGCKKESYPIVSKIYFEFSPLIINDVNKLLPAIEKDVKEIYKGKDEKTKNYIKDYELKIGSTLINSIQIIYEREYLGMSTCRTSTIDGKATLMLFKQDEFLEISIKKIIQKPSDYTMTGSYPIVSEISLEMHPKIKSIAHMWLFGGTDETSNIHQLPPEIVKHVASLLY